MIRNDNDILRVIDEYVTSHKDVIREEFNKVRSETDKFANKRGNNKNFEYKLEIMDIYKKYLENEQYILKDIIMLNKYDDVNDKINMFQIIFQTFFTIEAIFEKFKRVKQNFDMNKWSLISIEGWFLYGYIFILNYK